MFDLDYVFCYQTIIGQPNIRYQYLFSQAKDEGKLSGDNSDGNIA